jgi:hypothetical protein
MQGPASFLGLMTVNNSLVLSPEAGSPTLELRSDASSSEPSRIVLRDAGRVVWTLFSNRSEGQAVTLTDASSGTALRVAQGSSVSINRA